MIYRAFGALDAEERAARLRRITTDRGLLLLVGADARLAEMCGADGLHLPERMITEAGALRAAHPAWRLTAAAHGLKAAQAASRAGCDAVLVSPVFASASPSAGPPMGPEAFEALVRAAPLPVYALGGVNLRTAPLLAGSSAVGLAMIEGVTETVRI